MLAMIPPVLISANFFSARHRCSFRAQRPTAACAGGPAARALVRALWVGLPRQHLRA